MRYIVYFTDQTNIEVDEKVVEKIQNALSPYVDANNRMITPQWVVVLGHIIHMENITHVSSVESLANPHSGVITPKTPQQLKDERLREHQRIVNSPSLLTQRIRQKGEEEGGDVTL